MKQKRYVFKVINDEYNKILCLSIYDLDKEECHAFKTDNIASGVDMLSQENVMIIGHNILDFDLPLLVEHYPTFNFKAHDVVDTSIVAAIVNHDLGEESPITCATAINLYKELYNKYDVPKKALFLENSFKIIMKLQEKHGFLFDVDKACTLYDKLKSRFDEITAQIQNILGVNTTDFNIGSRMQVAEILKTNYNWIPDKLTPKERPVISEEILEKLPYEPCKLLSEYYLLVKRIGQLYSGQNSWFNMVGHDNRMHGRVNTMGAVTFRCTHSNPNMGQIPSTTVSYGKECRELFCVPKGYVQIGIDASGLELRCLAHYMAKYDGGSYAKQLLEGDIHSVNQEAAGLSTRSQAKTFIYALIYAAGSKLLGNIVGGKAREGTKLKNAFLAKFPAIKMLNNDLTRQVKLNGYIKGIDGRNLHVRHQHSALNTLLQSAGALIVKAATIYLYKNMNDRGYVWGKDWAIVAHVHDEIQLEVRKEFKEQVEDVAVNAFLQAGQYFKWKCRIDARTKSGINWAECH